MDMEFQRRQGCPGLHGVGLRSQQIRPERDQHPHRIGFLLKDGAVDIACGNPAITPRPKRALCHAQGFGALRRAQQIEAGDIAKPSRAARHIATGRAVVAGNGIEQADGPVGLRGWVLCDTPFQA